MNALRKELTTFVHPVSHSNTSSRPLKHPPTPPSSFIVSIMSPRPDSQESTGPVDGQDIKVNFESAPHYAPHKPHEEGGLSFGKVVLTGAALVGGLVGLYLLYKHFFSKKKTKQDD